MSTVDEMVVKSKLPIRLTLRQVVCDRFERIDKELPFGLEIAKLKDEVNRHRDRKHAVDQLSLCRAQIEVKEAIILGEAWQAVKIVDLLEG